MVGRSHVTLILTLPLLNSFTLSIPHFLNTSVFEQLQPKLEQKKNTNWMTFYPHFTPYYIHTVFLHSSGTGNVVLLCVHVIYSIFV